MNEEILAKAKAAGSPEELIELAKANGKEMTAEQAAAIFNGLTQGGEISDEELENAVGGCAWKPNFDCPGGGWKCKWCAASIFELGDSGWSRWACRECGNAVHTGGNNECCEHAKRYKKLDCTNCKWGRV